MIYVFKILVLISISTTICFCQSFDRLSVSMTTEAIGWPFTNYFPIHPGLELRTPIMLNDSPGSQQSFNLNLGAYYHRKLQSAIYAGLDYQYTRKVFSRQLGIDLPIGLGYLHTIYPGELYSQDDQGAFESVPSIGRPHLFVSLGLGFTYLGDGNRIQPFIRQSLMIQTPFANGIPVIPHSFLSAGIIIKLKIAENE